MTGALVALFWALIAMLGGISALVCVLALGKGR